MLFCMKESYSKIIDYTVWILKAMVLLGNFFTKNPELDFQCFYELKVS